MGDHERMKTEFPKQEGALPEPGTEASGQVIPRAFGISTPELQGGMEHAGPSTAEKSGDDDRTE